MLSHFCLLKMGSASGVNWGDGGSFQCSKYLNEILTQTQTYYSMCKRKIAIGEHLMNHWFCSLRTQQERFSDLPISDRNLIIEFQIIPNCRKLTKKCCSPFSQLTTGNYKFFVICAMNCYFEFLYTAMTELLKQKEMAKANTLIWTKYACANTVERRNQLCKKNGLNS